MAASAAAEHAQAYSILAWGQGGAVWTTDAVGQPCGQFAVGVWNPCSLELLYDSSVTSRSQWGPSIDAGASGWDNVYDYVKNRYPWLYRKYDSTYTNSVTVSAVDLGGPNANGSIFLGYANYSYYCLTTPCQMTYADTRLTTNSAVTWCFVNGQNCGNTGATYLGVMQDAAAHELGHDLGLDHPTHGPSNSGPVMQCSEARVLVGVTQDDKNGLLHDYSGHASSYPAPQAAPC